MEALSDHDPHLIGPYRPLASLGQGGMGRVYLAAGPDGQLIAVKHVLLHLAHDTGFRQRFALEVDTARRISSPHTVRLLDADTGAPQPWLATEFLPGPTLVEYLDAQGPLPEPQVRRLGLDLTAALSAIHGAGLVHRDLKPSNVIMTATGSKLLDYGISRAIDYSTSVALTQTGGVVGSPGYMSPEQAQSKPLTEQSDVFSLGCLLAVAATGRVPFEGPSVPQVLFKVVYEEPDLAGLPESLRAAVTRCLAKDPAERPTPAELTELLGQGEVAPDVPPAITSYIEYQHSRISALTTPPAATTVYQGPTFVLPPGPPAPPRRRPGKAVLAAAAAAVALVVFVPMWIVFGPDGDEPTERGSETDGTGTGEGESSSSLAVPSASALCDLLDPEAFADTFGSQWQVQDVEQDDNACRASVSDPETLAVSSISIAVVGTTADSWALCPFTDCDYDYDGVLVGAESTDRPWEMGGVVETGSALEMIWYEDGMAGTVRAMTMGADDESTTTLPDLLLAMGIALYDLSAA